MQNFNLAQSSTSIPSKRVFSGWYGHVGRSFSPFLECVLDYLRKLDENCPQTVFPQPSRPFPFGIGHGQGWSLRDVEEKTTEKIVVFTNLNCEACRCGHGLQWVPHFGGMGSYEVTVSKFVYSSFGGSRWCHYCWTGSQMTLQESYGVRLEARNFYLVEGTIKII